MTNLLREKIAEAGGVSQVARELGVSRQAVQLWVRREVPPLRVLSLERLTGISRHKLRPDIFGDN